MGNKKPNKNTMWFINFYQTEDDLILSIRQSLR